MASYLILTPPGGSDRNRDDTRFIRDGFCLTAFLFPALWMLSHRLWLHATAALLLQALGVALIGQTGLWAAGGAIILGVHLLAALEGRQALFASLTARGWQPEGLASAGNLATAEEIYFSSASAATDAEIRKATWDIPSRTGNTGQGGPAFGLPGYDGGR
jgi:hypothetical protein